MIDWLNAVQAGNSRGGYMREYRKRKLSEEDNYNNVTCYATADTCCMLCHWWRQLYRVTTLNTPFGLLISLLQSHTYNHLVLCVTFTQLTILHADIPPRTSRVGLLPRSASVSQSQSHVATDDQSVSKSWYRAPFGAHDQIFISVWQVRSCFRGAPSLTRGRVCLLYVPLDLARAIFLGS
jgi:hypothetical protein